MLGSCAHKEVPIVVLQEPFVSFGEGTPSPCDAIQETVSPLLHHQWGASRSPHQLRTTLQGLMSRSCLSPTFCLNSPSLFRKQVSLKLSTHSHAPGLSVTPESNATALQPPQTQPWDGHSIFGPSLFDLSMAIHSSPHSSSQLLRPCPARQL